ncbi:hypothetical protein ACFFGH_25495 [Lysobacter korlensis]|uniref:Uncharacterized protein n=1 Tax=Lysobacter korlensis TaxID=553636 RepID=A0ABV6RW40_9GAMM
MPGASALSRIATASIAVALSIAILTGCASSYRSPGAETDAPSCATVFDDSLTLARGNVGTNDLNSNIDWLSRNCSAEYDTLIDYVSTRASAEGAFGPQTCAFLAQHVSPDALTLLRTDRVCTDDASPSDEGASGSIEWDAAINYIGQTGHVCGPLTSMRHSEDDVFLNLGLDYPHPGRFTIVLWDVGGVEQLPAGTRLCASGPITSYEGTAQIELRSIEAVEVYG